jgi:hypothetical protein
MSKPQQAQQATKKTSRVTAAPQKGVKRKILISKIKVVPALYASGVIETQY